MPQIAAAICRPFCRLWRLFCLYSISVPMHRSLSLSFSSVRLNCSLCPALIDSFTPARFHTKRRTLKADPRRLTSSRPFSSHLAIHHRFSRVVASDLSTCIISIFCLISDERICLANLANSEAISEMSGTRAQANEDSLSMILRCNNHREHDRVSCIYRHFIIEKRAKFPGSSSIDDCR